MGVRAKRVFQIGRVEPFESGPRALDGIPERVGFEANQPGRRARSR